MVFSYSCMEGCLQQKQSIARWRHRAVANAVADAGGGAGAMMRFHGRQPFVQR